MAINEWKVLQKIGIFKAPPKPPAIDVDKDVDALLLSLNESAPVIKEIAKLLVQFKALRKKEKTTKSDKELKNIIEEQVQVYDRILQQFEYYELEVDISGERVKNISTVLGKKAKDAAISSKWLSKIKKSERWIFDW